MILFPCSHCGEQLNVTDDLAGKKAKCPQCQQTTPVPHPAAATASLTPESQPLPPTPLPSSEAATIAPPPVAPGEGGSEAVTVGVVGTLPTGPNNGATTPVVPGYEILAELGRGGMGVVYKARQERPRRLVALKMVLAGEHAGAEALARFRTEAEAVARLNHPNIVQIHEVGEHQGRPFLTLEFVGGGNLAHYLQQNKLAWLAAAELVHQLARAVAFAHQRGILHRDLKPANILLDAQPQDDPKGQKWIPKIADFGLAKQIDSTYSLAPAAVRTQSGAILGTPSYMAPEQVEGKSKKVGPAADIYALGAILYEMLAGQPTFQAETMIDTLMQVVSQEPTPPRQLRPSCPRDLETICLKCLEKDPRKRYTTAGELADDLKRFLDGEAIRARPAGKLERVGRALRKRKDLVYLIGGAVGAVCLVVLVLALTLYFKAPAGVVGPPETSAAGTGAAGSTEEDMGVSRIEQLARHQRNANKLKQLAQGLHSLADNHQFTLPPAAITDPRTGRPLLSWRVAILPYVEQSELYKQFKRDEPWDGPHNSKLLAQMPNVFASEGVQTPRPNRTFYQVFVGPGTAFEPQQGKGGPSGAPGVSLMVPDGTSNTILIAEAAEAVPWTKPVDLAYDPQRPLPALGASSPDGFNVALCDGSVRFVKKTVSEKTLRVAITRNGGEVLGSDWLTEEEAARQQAAANLKQTQPK